MLKHVTLVALLAVLLLAASSRAEAPSAPSVTSSKRVNVKGQARHTPPSENPYFTGDPSDPRVLIPTPEFLERGFDGGYVERMARPPLPASAFEQARAQVPPRGVRLEPPAMGTASPFAAISQQGSVIVVEGNNNLVINTPDGLGFNHDNGLFFIAQDIINQFGDNFDFITVWLTFPEANPNVAAYYLPLRQDIEGLGECNFNAGDTFGCIFDSFDPPLRLQGLVFMNSISTWRSWDRDYDGAEHAIDSFDSAIYSTLGQEIAHRWGSGLRFVDPRTGAVSKKLLGRDSSHWAAFVDTDASVMDGWDWEPAGSNFQVVDDMNIFSTLDLYTMGALPVASAKPFFFIDGAKYTGIGDPQVDGRNVGATDGLGFGSISLLESFGVTIQATGERVDLTIQDVVNAEGNRCPDPDHTQKTYTQAMVLVTRTGQSAASASAFAEELDVVNDTWEKWWLDRTGKALTLCTGLGVDCLQASATLAGGFLDTPAADGDLIEPGDDITLHVDVNASGDKVKNAKLVLELQGAGADHATLKKTEIDLGDLDVDSELDVPVEISFNEDTPCGSPTTVIAAIVSDNAPTITEQYRLFPGYDQVFFESFGKSDDFEADNSDAETGGLERIDVQLTCDITPQTPERDASPANAGAYITGNTAELKGNANLLSPVIDLRGTIKPQIRFNYWLDGDGFLLVELSDDGGDSFVDAIKYEKTAHEWQPGFVDIAEELGSVPDEIVMRFTFQSRDGEVEGGIDEVRVLARAGQCAGFLGCGCSANSDGSPAAALFAALGLLALRAVRRRQR